MSENNDGFRPRIEDSAAWWEALSFMWMSPLMVYGHSNRLEMHHLPPISEDFKTSYLQKEFNEKSEGRSLGSSLYRMARTSIWIGGGAMLAYTGCQVSQPLLLKFLIEAIQNEEFDGIYFVIGLFFCQFIGAISNQQHFHLMFKVGQKMRSVIISMVFRKALSLHSSALSGWSLGDIVNLMSNDSQKYFELMPQFHLIWAAPTQIAITAYFLIDNLGIAALAGIAVLVALVPINTILARILDGTRREHLPTTDERVRLCGESLSAMRLVKLFSWESSILGKIFELREVEHKFISREMNIFAVQIWLMIVVPSMAMAATFSTYVLLGNKMDAATVFSSLAFFNVLRFPLMYMGAVIMTGVQTLVSTRRLEKFLGLKEDPSLLTSPKRLSSLSTLSSGQFLSRPGSTTALNQDKGGDTKIEMVSIGENMRSNVGSNVKDLVSVRDAGFRWSERTPEISGKEEKGSVVELLGNDEKDTKSKDFILSSVNISVSRGDLLVVIGEVGAGKSSLLASILGETHRISGSLKKPLTVGYAAQEAWIMGASIRENIVFGSAFEEGWYRRVLSACALVKDLKELKHEDSTIVGERGVTLSGGQMARVSLARAVYARHPLLLADDPLSALDAHTGKHIFENVFSSRGIARQAGRAVILVTHAVQYLKDAKKVAFMKDGKILMTDTYQNLKRAHEEKKFDRATLKRLASFLARPEESIDEKKRPERGKLGTIAKNKKDSKENRLDLTKKKNKLHSEEERNSGTVAFEVYSGYIKKAGGCLFVTCLITGLIFDRITYLGADWWLTRWIAATEGNGGTFGLPSPVDTQQQNNQYLGVYLLWVFVNFIFAYLRLIVFSWGAAKATTGLFKDMARAVFRSPMRFFETTPLGRIINRFSYDAEVLDFPILEKLNGSVASMFWLMSAVTIIIFVQPIMAAVLIIVLFLYYKLQLYYRRSSVQIQRLDSNSRSPIQAHFAESLSGAITVRAFGAVNTFIEVMERTVEENAKAVLAYRATSRWLGVRLETLGAFVTVSTGLLCWIYRSSISGELTGLALLWAFNFTVSLNFLVQNTTEAESKMNSAERMLFYSALPSEAKLEDDDDDDNLLKKKRWPMMGKVEFKNVVMSYADHLPPALKNCTFTLLPGEKVGVVGRTGAGKSTLAAALFRLRELTSGTILVDNVDISKLGLHSVRGTGICIIPQSPVLFSGTIRYNLDPFDKHSDSEIWKALKSVHMDKLVKELPGRLMAKVDEQGSNFSVGQRQLLCVVRAIIRQPKVLVVDEATASVDPQTDETVQKALKTEFKSTTQLTIAHRLHTIVDSDKVLVMDQGSVAEFGAPAELLKKGGIFKSLIEATGRATSAQLHNLAMHRGTTNAAT